MQVLQLRRSHNHHIGMMFLSIVVIALFAGSVPVVAADAENSRYRYDLLPEDIRDVAHAQTLAEAVNRIASAMVSDIKNCLYCFDLLPEDIREVAHAQVQAEIVNRIASKMVFDAEARHL